MTDLDFIVICSYKDSVKFYDIYIPLGEEIVKDLEKHSYKIGRAVSHGLCPSCYKSEITKLRHERLMKQAESYLNEGETNGA